jgi:hypothetical protein
MNVRFLPLVCLVVAGLAILSAVATVPAQDVDPHPQPWVIGRPLHRWSFAADCAGWTAAHDCQLSSQAGVMHIVASGADPYLIVKLPSAAPGPVMVRLRLRSTMKNAGQVFWTTDRQPRTAEEQSRHFEITHDGQWHEYQVPLEVEGVVQRLRFDPGTGPGEADVAWIELQDAYPYPLVIERMTTTPREIRLALRNRGRRSLTVTVAGKTFELPSGQTTEAVQSLAGQAPFEAVPVVVEVKGLASIRRSVIVCHPEAPCEWLALKSGPLTLRVTRDGRGAQILRDGKLVALVAPLVLAEAEIVPLRVIEQQERSLQLAGAGVRARLTLGAETIDVLIQADRSVEGPVVRPLGGVKQGLLAGLEYLGRGERSSSTLDIETEEHLRFAPDPLQITLPLAVCVTERASVALVWHDMTLQPTYAVPNFVDGRADEQRMSLRGRQIEATVRIAGGNVEDAILWAVRRQGLPPLPRPPRDRQAQLALAMQAIRGPIAGPGGWAHCAEPRWQRGPLADVASTIWRITGEAPALERLVPGGAHVRNDAIYFVTGRAQQWLDRCRGEVRATLGRQQPDGSFRYQGKFLRGHFEDTASGYCALPAMHLLDFAWATGDPAARAAGLKTLEYMKRFCVPRGAQTWELSLHTPDILASAYLVRAYLRGYQLTGKQEYLARARSWALSGVPFVYLWSRYPTMLYATPPVYGATNYRAPLWIGLPVQWCGGVYAYALVQLAPYDRSLDWRRLAEGIYTAAQQIQYPDGPLAGCLPDVFTLTTQERSGPSINPSAVVSLQLALEGRPDGLVVAVDKRHRVVAPFAVHLDGKHARIDGRAGTTYQALVDGRVVDIRSQGQDLVKLE